MAKTEVRPHLAAIARHAAAGNEVFVGVTVTGAYSAFISLGELKRRRSSLPSSALDIETLRRNWSRGREQVENSGRPLRILRKGEPLAALAPTGHALSSKVARTLENLDRQDIKLLHDLGKRVAALETHTAGNTVSLQAMREIIDDGVLQELLQGIGLVRQYMSEWRKAQGLPP